MSEMIERVARNLARRHLNDTGKQRFDENPSYWYDSFGDGERAEYEEIARAAIEAMREPTDEMMMAAEHDVPELESFADKDKSPSYIAWQAMIDAAISSGDRGGE